MGCWTRAAGWGGARRLDLPPWLHEGRKGVWEEEGDVTWRAARQAAAGRR